MHENDASNSPSHNNDKNNTPAEYLRRAETALAGGDTTLSLHLYLAAFELSSRSSLYPSDATVKGLRQAWKLACNKKERSLAEHIFEKLEPYLSPEEMSLYAEQLQQLAIDKLEEFGLDKQNLEDVTQMLSQDMFGLDSMSGFFQAGIKPAFSLPTRMGGSPSKTSENNTNKDKSLAVPEKKHADQKPEDQAFDKPTYSDIVGYDGVIDYMKRFGIGSEGDAEFDALVKELNSYHGLDRMPIVDTFVFRSPVREDANHFMLATLGEIDLPAIRMCIEENIQGMPVLCVMAQANEVPKLNAMRSLFEGGGVLILENIDLWGIPFAESMGEGFDGFMQAQFSRGAREAINLIRSAVENPEVYVLTSLSSESELDSFFFDILGPTVTVDIDYPTDKERADLWEYLMQRHPSLRQIDRHKLITVTARMARYDICIAAREAVEEAYRNSLERRQYQPVSADALFEKLAAYQPLESQEYKQLEEAVLDDFRKSLDNLEDLLGHGGETT